MIDRRKFLSHAACGLGAAALARVPGAGAAGTQGRIEVLVDESTAVISPDLYGYLLENLGTVIYDGVWVGEKSKIANIGGLRKELIERMRDINASVIRWPGGNFADYYDWQDGVGPRANRPRRTNFWADYMPREASNGPQAYDPNQFGTPELLQLCKLTGGRPYLNVNTRALSPQDFSRWVEYCNSPAGSTTLADSRKANGSKEPYNVRYWGIGNEVWGAGGSLTAEEYATLYKRFVTQVSKYGTDLAFVAAGAPPGASTEWIRRFLEIMHRTFMPVPIFAISVHYYAGLFTNDFTPGETIQGAKLDELEKKLVEPLKFGTAEWYDLLSKSTRLESVIESHWRAMAEWDPAHKIKIAVDEWGGIFKGGTELTPANIRGRTVTLRDALAAALTLDIFHGQCDKLAVANFTGLINQEGGIFQTDEERFVTTPIYEVFRMYAAHQGGKRLRTLFDVPSIGLDSAPLQALSGSASLKDRQLTLSVVNPDVSNAWEATISIRGARASRGAISVLTHREINAHNTFDAPHQIAVVNHDLGVDGASSVHMFPPRSVSCLTLELS